MMLMDEEFTASLRAAKTPEEFLQIIDQADEDAEYEAVSKFMQETL